MNMIVPVTENVGRLRLRPMAKKVRDLPLDTIIEGDCIAWLNHNLPYP